MTEQEIIASLQKDTAYMKRLLDRMAKKSAALVTINQKDGRIEASADAMAWQSDLVALHADLLDAHSRSTKALVKHYGADIVAAGPFR